MSFLRAEPTRSSDFSSDSRLNHFAVEHDHADFLVRARARHGYCRYNNQVPISYDPAKRAKTLAERSLDFEDASLVFEGRFFETEDLRKDYGERRMICFGMLRDRMVVIGYTPRGADRHVFSMRKANDREQATITPLLGL